MQKNPTHTAFGCRHEKSMKRPCKSSVETIYPSAPHFNDPLKSHKLSQWQPPVHEMAYCQRLPIFSTRYSYAHSLECWHTTQRIKYTIIQSIRNESIYFQFQLNTHDDTHALDPICSELCCLCKYNENWAIPKHRNIHTVAMMLNQTLPQGKKEKTIANFRLFFFLT